MKKSFLFILCLSSIFNMHSFPPNGSAFIKIISGLGCLGFSTYLYNRGHFTTEYIKGMGTNKVTIIRETNMTGFSVIPVVAGLILIHSGIKSLR